MNIGVVIVVSLVLIVVLFAAVFFFDLPGRVGGGPSTKGNMKAIVEAQRYGAQGPVSRRQRVSVMETATESRVDKTASSKMTLTKRLKYAQWKMPPALFHLLEISLSLVAFCVVAFLIQLSMVAQVMTLVIGPLFMRFLLTRDMERRFKLFDKDYPSFLLSLVGLLKTGMNPMGAIEAACHGLEDGCILRTEIELMLERLRYGVPEDASIGSFGEDIAHPEIELFVQALLLSRRVGGTLSDTLDRLAKQVGKRQYFRRQAVAAVGMQRGSIWFIIGVMVALEGYLYWIYPVAVTGAWQDPVGWQVWQGGVGVVLLGIYWVRQVTKLRV